MLSTASQVAAAAALTWAAVSMWLAIGTLVRRRRFEARGRLFVVPPLPVRVLLVRPCAGEEQALERCLSSILRARWSFSLDVVFGVSSADDPAVGTIERVVEAATAAGISARLLVVEPTGPNRKASTLAGVVEQLGRDHQVLISIDSNVDLDGYDLDQLVGRVVAEPGAGMVWSPFVEYAVRPSLGSRASIAMMGGALTSFPLLASLSERSLSGKFWAIDLDRLSEVGGLSPLVDYLGEDFELEQRLWNAGHPPIAVPCTAHAVAPALSFADAVHRVSRWMLVVRAQRAYLLPVYPLLFASTPLNLALAGFGFVDAPVMAWVAAALALAARFTIASAGSVYSGRGWGPVRALVDSVLADALILTAWVRTVFTREVAWRGNVLRVQPAGKVRLVRSIRAP